MHAFVDGALALVARFAQQHDGNVAQVIGMDDAPQDLQAAGQGQDSYGGARGAVPPQSPSAGAPEQEGSGRRNAFTDTSLISRVGELCLNYVAGQEPSPFAGNRLVDALQLAALLGGALFAGLAIGLVVRRGGRRDKHAAVVAGVVAGGAIALPLFLAVVGIDFINPRNLIGALVPLLILLALGFGMPRSGLLGLGAAGGMCALFAVVLAATNVSSQMQRPDWRGAAEATRRPLPAPAPTSCRATGTRRSRTTSGSNGCARVGRATCGRP